jgi:DNA-binding IclR family transcriptional regulator
VRGGPGARSDVRGGPGARSDVRGGPGARGAVRGGPGARGAVDCRGVGACGGAAVAAPMSRSPELALGSRALSSGAQQRAHGAEVAGNGFGGERRNPVGKALRMLAWMAESGERSWGIRQAARGLGLPPSTAHRTVAMLQQAGALTAEKDGRYRFSLDFICMAARVAAELPLRRAALPHMERLVSETDETTYLAIYSSERKRIMYVDRIESHHPLRYVLPLYEWLPMHAGAGGEAVLAFLPEADIESVLSTSDLAMLTTKTVTDPSQLRREFLHIREHGYIETRGRLIEGTVGMAAPVFGPADAVVGSIVVALPEIRLNPEASHLLGTKLAACADAVSADLGGMRPHG